MDAFSYLSVLLSIIIGLAITQVLQGYRGLLLSRRRVKAFAPPLIWSASILLIAVQMWWSSFGLADRPEWTFGAFAIILLQTVLFYMMAGLVLPDLPPSEPIDLEAHYFREATPFYSIFVVIVLVSVAKNLLLDGGMRAAEWTFHAIFIAIGVVAMLRRGRALHHVIAGGVALAFLTYIALLFTRL